MTWLFVYGTLRAGGSAEGLLAERVVERRPATLPGHALYGRTMSYPFAVEDPGSVVVGEAVCLDLHSATSTLTELDRYEGDEYRRVRRRILGDGWERTADVWIAVDDTRFPESERIPTGDWVRRDL